LTADQEKGGRTILTRKVEPRRHFGHVIAGKTSGEKKNGKKEVIDQGITRLAPSAPRERQNQGEEPWYEFIKKEGRSPEAFKGKNLGTLLPASPRRTRH